MSTKTLTPAKRIGRIAEQEFIREDSLARAFNRASSAAAASMLKSNTGSRHDLLYLEQEISAAYRELQSARRAQDAIDRLTATVQS